MNRIGFMIWAAALALAAAASAARAEIRVVASIAPVHSLVARVMQGAGEAHLLTPAGASPHHFAMRPSEAKALRSADLVFWVGPGMEGWMTRPIATLAKGRRVVALSEADDVIRLTVRKGGVWEPHAHGSHEHEEQGHEKHGHEEHGHEEHGREEGVVDQHFWLDPQNAKAWVVAIVRELVAADPANLEIYKANAFHALKELDALQLEIEAQLAPVADKPFIVFHDAYQYFETRFALGAVGAIALPDAGSPGPARLGQIRGKIRESGAACVFTEPQFPPKLARMAVEGAEARIASLDPLGANIEPGPAHYPALMRGLATGLRDCLGEKTTAERH